MDIDISSLNSIISKYDLVSSNNEFKPLDGYSDKNYLFVDANNFKRYVLKVVFDKQESKQELTSE